MHLEWTLMGSDSADQVGPILTAFAGRLGRAEARVEVPEGVPVLVLEGRRRRGKKGYRLDLLLCPGRDHTIIAREDGEPEASIDDAAQGPARRVEDHLPA